MRYGILKACTRCVYAKSHEPVLIVSLHRGPRILVNFNGRTYVRTSKCVGVDKCGKCLALEHPKQLDTLPCKWKLLR